ncbi:hypothetical protein IAT40_004896 [Kwoniella sp. CBS 6097]
MKVQIRHGGRTQDLEIDVTNGSAAFKGAIYGVTGVPVERMKVMVKGTVLKVIGTAGPLPAPPSKPTVFGEIALASGNPPGFVNLGQTCYLNSTLQALRTVPNLIPTLSDSLHCNDAPDEAQTTSIERVLKLECNISVSTNFLLSGIIDVSKFVMTSAYIVGFGSATGENESHIRPHGILHTVRFYWRRDIQKKAKIMRKVKFPLHFDALELVSASIIGSCSQRQATDELRQQVQPSNALVKQILAERDDRYKSAKRSGIRDTSGLALEEEARRDERERLRKIVGTFDDDANPSGMYELSAMVTHKGASADSDALSIVPSGEEEWYKFDDDKVTTVKA